MRPLILMWGAFGLLVGLLAAVVLHGLPATLVGDFGWSAYVAPDALPAGTKVSITLNWMPSLLWLGGAGLVLGLVAALVLGRLGWRLTRPSVS